MLGHQPILQNINLAVPTGKVVGLLGPSGAGKTTLMRVLVGRQRPSHGSVEILGLQAGAALLRKQIGYVTQAPSVYADLTVTENLRYFAVLIGAPRRRIDQVLSNVNLVPQAHQLVATLSGGQKSRVSLAVALLGEPKLLVLDEPTVGIDPVLRAELWRQFRQLANGGVTLLVSSHVMEEAEHCDRLLLIRDGKLLADDTREGLLTQTGTKDVEAGFLKLVEEAK